MFLISVYIYIYPVNRWSSKYLYNTVSRPTYTRSRFVGSFGINSCREAYNMVWQRQLPIKFQVSDDRNSFPIVFLLFNKKTFQYIDQCYLYTISILIKRQVNTKIIFQIHDDLSSHALLTNRFNSVNTQIPYRASIAKSLCKHLHRKNKAV